jgi:hypothetical protein
MQLLVPIIEIALALAALATGLWAAWLWQSSSRVQVDLGYSTPGAPPTFKRLIFDPQTGRPLDVELPRFVEPPGGDAAGQIAATWDAMARAAPLNARAARWTAASVAVAAIGTVLSALLGHVR